jgi:hypothetical protein
MKNFSSPSGTLGRRLLWFAGLWAASVATVLLVGYALRLVIKGF